jgi:hypothetical protein
MTYTAIYYNVDDYGKDSGKSDEFIEAVRVIRVIGETVMNKVNERRSTVSYVSETTVTEWKWG